MGFTGFMRCATQIEIDWIKLNIALSSNLRGHFTSASSKVQGAALYFPSIALDIPIKENGKLQSLSRNNQPSARSITGYLSFLFVFQSLLIVSECYHLYLTAPLVSHLTASTRDGGNFEVISHCSCLMRMLPPSFKALKFSEDQLSHILNIIHMQKGTHIDDREKLKV